jgi:hypothetical protein
MKGRKDHTRSADSTLGAAAIKESLLQCPYTAVSGQAFDGNDGSAIRLKRRDQAAIHQHSVEQNAAGATLTLATTFFRPRQSQFVPQDVHQALHRVHPHRRRLSVYRDKDLAFLTMV